MNCVVLGGDKWAQGGGCVTPALGGGQLIYPVVGGWNADLYDFVLYPFQVPDSKEFQANLLLMMNDSSNYFKHYW